MLYPMLDLHEAITTDNQLPCDLDRVGEQRRSSKFHSYTLTDGLSHVTIGLGVDETVKVSRYSQDLSV